MGSAKEVFFIADDFGMSSEVNEAIIYAHCKGVLQGASLMMGQEGTQEAVKLARENRDLQVGFHWHITDSRPLSVEHWPWGGSPARAGISVGLFRESREMVFRELDRQWEEFQATGLRCEFANSHHHLHIHPFLLGPFLDRVTLAEGGWVRLGSPRLFGNPGSTLPGGFPNLLKWWGLGKRSCPPSPATLWGIDRTFSMNADEVLGVLGNLPEGRHEFIFHPRRIGNDRDMDCLLQLRECGEVHG